MLQTSSTVRACAQHFGISKSTVHKDITHILKKQNPALYKKIKALLDKNRQERHFRGGEATRKKYLVIKQTNSQT